MRYNPARLSHQNILTDEQRSLLRTVANACPIGLVFDDSRRCEEWMVDYVYTSARIEGNLYDRIDADILLRLGITAEGKQYADAKALLNIRTAFFIAMKADATTKLDEDYVCELHKVLTNGSSLASRQGLARAKPSTTGASAYRPLSNPAKHREELKAILAENAAYTDCFERAIHLHCNIACLQFFDTGNKQVARLVQTAILVQSGIMPLFFQATLID